MQTATSYVFVLATVCATLGPVGCGDDECQAPISDAADAPRIDDMRLIGQLTSDSFPVQSDDPWLVILGTQFRDNDGDLGAGEARFFMGDETQPSLTQDMQTVFLQSGVTPDATRGEVWVSLRFSETTPDGTRARLGMQLVDAAAQRSNCYSLELSFDVSPVSAP